MYIYILITMCIIFFISSLPQVPSTQLIVSFPNFSIIIKRFIFLWMSCFKHCLSLADCIVSKLRLFSAIVDHGLYVGNIIASICILHFIAAYQEARRCKTLKNKHLIKHHMFNCFMEACITPLPELSDFEYVKGSAIKKCIGHECYFGTTI